MSRVSRALFTTGSGLCCRSCGPCCGCRGNKVVAMSITNEKTRVELHVHLDGAVRPSTIFELAQKKGIGVPAQTPEELRDAIRLKDIGNLKKFLEKFTIFMPVISGDAEAIKRIAYEFCEDCAKQHIRYVEARYCPHLLTQSVIENSKPLTPREVVVLVNNAFKRGEKDFGIKVRSLLCCMRGMTEWSWEVLMLCVEFKNDGVVGIDIAGDEQVCEDEPTHEQHIKVFQEAKRLGINRTVHAGENGPASVVKEAIVEMHADRIGHGYHSKDNPEVYRMVKEMRLHLEVCPYSSYVTGSFCGDFSKHPAKKFLLDGINFSISTDDPILTARTLSDEYELCKNKMGMTDEDFAVMNLNAAEASFLPVAEKEQLVEELRAVYGMA